MEDESNEEWIRSWTSNEFNFLRLPKDPVEVVISEAYPATITQIKQTLGSLSTI